ncbi:TPA: Gfo/Idh/MocA family oxidoreductase [Pluralibacter gergoviae]|nr:Gfo/Idh/MocA family oxidoreductase [Pluralibacter gergoviae]
MTPLKVIVCGSTFGQFWLAALARYPQRFTVAGLLAGGSARSRACAERHGIPLWTSPEALPDDIDIACVVLRASVLGGEGSALAQALMAKGIHVIQEQPLHHDEVAANLRCARRCGVYFRVGNLYPHLPAVRQFCDAARLLLRRQAPQYIDAACAGQVAFPLIAMLEESLGALRPWQFAAAEQPPGAPWQTVQGSLAGIPLTLRVHNEVDPDDPDNHFKLLHQITLGFPAGRLSLTDTHGPVIWSPRLHIPEGVKQGRDFSGADAAHLQEETSAALGEPDCDSWRTALAERWPEAIAADLLALSESLQAPGAPAWQPQALLARCQAWQALTQAIGYPRLVPGQIFRPLARTLLPETRRPAAPAAAQPDFCARAETLIADIGAQEVRAFVAAMDDACLDAMLFSLQEGGALLDPDRGWELPALMAQLRVAAQHRPLIARWLALLADAGRLTLRGGCYFSAGPLARSDLDARWRAVHRAWDNRLGTAAFIDYLWDNARLLFAAHQRSQQAALLLFPEGRSDVAEAVYQHTITARYLNTLIGDWILDRLTDGAPPLRVLEVGAGTGATTERVRELLRPRYGDAPPLAWTFSDVSNFFLINARRRYAGLEWISTALLDIDRPPQAQGIAPGSQDLLVMAGVLNNARDSEQTVRGLAQALAPGGHMLVSEPTREHLEILISQAFMMPPPQDDRRRSGLRFLTVAQWRDLFRRAGLEVVASLPDEGHLLAPLGQRLFIVRRPPDAAL